MTITLNFTYLSTAQRAGHWQNIRLRQLLWVFFQRCFRDLMEVISKSIITRSKCWDHQKNWKASFKQGFCTKVGACSLYCLRSIKQSFGNRGRARAGAEAAVRAGRGILVGVWYAGKESRVPVTCQSGCSCWSLEIGDTILGATRWQTAPQCGQVGHCVGHQLLLKLQAWSEGSNQTTASAALARRLWDLCYTLSCKTMTHPSQVVFN